MKILSSILQRTGVSQRNLSSFIGANHTILSRSTIGTRSIPTNALLKLAQLQLLLKALPATAKPIPTQQEAADMKQQATWCIAQCHPLKKQLAKMQQSHQQAATMLQLLDAYIANNEIAPGKQQRWVDEQRYQAQKKMVQNGWMPQQQLINKIALLNYEAGLCKATDA